MGMEPQGALGEVEFGQGLHDARAPLRHIGPGHAGSGVEHLRSDAHQRI